MNGVQNAFAFIRSSLYGGWWYAYLPESVLHLAGFISFDPWDHPPPLFPMDCRAFLCHWAPPWFPFYQNSPNYSFIHSHTLGRSLINLLCFCCQCQDSKKCWSMRSERVPSWTNLNFGAIWLRAWSVRWTEMEQRCCSHYRERVTARRASLLPTPGIFLDIWGGKRGIARQPEPRTTLMTEVQLQSLFH